MEWKCAWKELPIHDGMYLCDIENHYGIFEFSEGKFQPNDFSYGGQEYSGYALNSHFRSDNEHCISHWCELPIFREVSLEEKQELAMLRKKREKEERKKYRLEKEAKRIRGY
jgi:hypothetical protein